VMERGGLGADSDSLGHGSPARERRVPELGGRGAQRRESEALAMEMGSRETSQLGSRSCRSHGSSVSASSLVSWRWWNGSRGFAFPVETETLTLK
jgi:hypothetical protein